MDWRIVSALLRIARDEAQHVYREHQRRVLFALALLVLSPSWRPLLRKWLLRLHYEATAAKPKLTYQPTPANERLLARCPLLRTKMHAPWYLSNGHAQTLRLAAQMRSKEPRINYQREMIRLPDGGTVSLDWALPTRADGSTPTIAEVDPTVSTMIILPGLTGGSDEFYIRTTVHEMLAQHWQVVVLNARGCARTPLTSPQLFSCANTEDFRFVLRMFQDRYSFLQTASLIAVGFSMGANVLVKYLGEDGEHALVTAAVSVGNPFDMVRCSRSLKSSFLHRNTYYAALTVNLKRLFFHKSNAHEAFKDHPLIDLELLRQSKDIDEFDERLTCIVFGYKDAHEYYTDGSSDSRVPLVRVPLLCINAEDDPISAPAAIPFDAIRENPHVVLCLTKTGGHLAFYESDYHNGSDHVPAKAAVARAHAPVWSARAIAEYAESFRAALV